MKKLLSVFLTLCLVFTILPMGMFTITVNAETVTSGITGDCIWSLDGTVLTISGNGAMEDYDNSSSSPWSRSITEVIIENGVTNIGRLAFRECASLTNVTIPDSVTNIGTWTFLACQRLKNIILPEGITKIGDSVFAGCTGLNDIIIPNTVTSIDVSAFYGCDGLINITIPASVTNIGSLAFYGCTGIENIYYAGSISDKEKIFIDNNNECFEDATWHYNSCIDKTTHTYDNDYDIECNVCGYIREPAYLSYTISNGEATITDCDTSFSGDLVIPSTLGSYPVTSIGDYAFSDCTGLTSIAIPDSVTRIDDYAFYECDGLTSIAIPDSVTSVGAYAFYGCSSLNAVYITDIVSWCTIKFGDKDNGLGAQEANPLYYAQNLYLNGDIIENLIITGDISEISDHAFINCKSLKSIIIAEGVQKIGVGAFENCSNVNRIELPNSLTYISGAAFSGINITGCLNIPENVNYIGRYAFSSCKNLYEISIGSGVEEIGDYAFAYCSKLFNILFKYRDDVSYNDDITIGWYAFYMCDSLSNVWCAGDVGFFNCSIGLYNEDFDNATWHYNTCIDNHFYSGSCDTHCNKCEWSRSVETSHSYSYECDSFCNVCDHQRETKEHTFDNACDKYCNVCFIERTTEHNFNINDGYTCSVCKFSRKPDKPIIKVQTYNSVTLKEIEGLEYSIDRVVWQTSPTFVNLSANTEYTFYQRIKESDVAFVSEMSDGQKAIIIKYTQLAIPSAPVVSSFTDTTVTLILNADYEYSKDGTTWQTSNVFTDLSPGTKYTFYQRYAETDTHEASDKSLGTSITTDKSKQTLVPDAPTVQSFTESSITLTLVDGYEYSKDGTSWQLSNVFSGLSCGTEYTFYQRYKETSTTYVGKSSLGFAAKTDKGTQSVPSAPTLLSKTHKTVTLTAINGYEYSRDGINWQTNNLFNGLDPETNYIFYQRKAENDRYYASSSSLSLIVKTLDISSVKNGWVYEGDKWAYYEDGEKLKNCWKLDSIGWCYLGSDGYMRTNSWIMDSQGWCYVGADGYCLTNAWMLDSVGWCYLNSEGRMATNSWILDSVGWCYVGADGYCVTNAWMKDSVGWCYLDAEGRMATNRWVMDSVGWCYVGADGYAVTNCWKQDSHGWCYLNSEGSMTKSAWVLDGGVWYYLDGNGYMVTGGQLIGGTWYNFASSGAWIG